MRNIFALTIVVCTFYFVFYKQKSLSQEQGGRIGLIKRRPPPCREACGNSICGGRPDSPWVNGLQLRDSAGLSPASPLGLPIRGKGAAKFSYLIVKNRLFQGYHTIYILSTPFSLDNILSMDIAFCLLKYKFDICIEKKRNKY
jgi:hypothetical protein